MKKQLLAELLETGLDLDLFFNISVSHEHVRMLADFDEQLLNTITEIGFLRYNYLYMEDPDNLEYKFGNLIIILMSCEPS